MPSAGRPDDGEGGARVNEHANGRGLLRAKPNLWVDVAHPSASVPYLKSTLANPPLQDRDCPIGRTVQEVAVMLDIVAGVDGLLIRHVQSATGKVQRAVQGARCDV